VLPVSAADCQYDAVTFGFASLPYPVDALLARLLVYIIAKHFRLRTDSHAISDLLDAHLLQHLLVHVHKIFSIDVIPPKDIYILSAANTLQPVAHAGFVPVLYRFGSIISI
jgi:hypothetical protein